MTQVSLIERADRLCIRDVQAAIPKSSVAVTLQFEGRSAAQEILVIGRLTNLQNGYRYYFVCPECQETFMNLYRRDFGRYAAE